MGNRINNVKISVAANGLSVASGAASARSALPNMASGEAPRYIRVSATVAACVRLGDSGVVATAASTQVQPGDSCIFSVNGATHIAYIQVAAAGVVNVVPLEDM